MTQPRPWIDDLTPGVNSVRVGDRMRHALGQTAARAIVLARGLGTRMRVDAGIAALAPGQAAAAGAGLKTMIPFERPFIDYLLHNLADGGITDVCIVIGPEHGTVRDHYARLAPKRLRVSFAEQAEPRGTADAVYAARTFAGRDPFVVVNGDNLYPVEAIRALLRAAGPAMAGFSRSGLASGHIPPERLAAFAVVAQDRGWMTHIVEKPDPAWVAAEGDALVVSMNCWRLGPELFEVIPTLPLSPRGELELPTAVQTLVDGGVRVQVLPFDLPVLDLSHRMDVAEVGRLLAGREVML